MDLEQILELVKNLTDEDKARLQNALTTTVETKQQHTDDQPEVQGEDIEMAENADAVADSEVEAKAEEVIADIETIKAEGEPNEQVTEDEKELMDTIAKDEQSDKVVEETTTDGDVTGANDSEPIPAMVKGEQEQQSPPKEVIPAEVAPIVDEQGGEMPVDYQQIIDGLNAKVMAVEAENKMLKAKVEGAFGLSGKPGGFVPVNQLYSNDTSDIPRMRK